ncbi:hypothetical protein TNCT_229981 [Trichonephila clavata]|uniref:Uncharacterized protein n=1 Tax=Trichonephila clavata TaxID=2740835 RepID=A0A8X6KHU6_TRICU|nr:hypothetical protein TNCT_229981 [Trichonephila clavata]
MPPLKLFGRPIPWSTSVEYLGITLDKKLTYKNHLSKIKCKFKQSWPHSETYSSSNQPYPIKTREGFSSNTYNHCLHMVALFGAWRLKPTSENSK